ncbi:hypothetical protein BC937DRAFT_94041 [Endogone sp. FLAS-F59071]|nr:hypothetical protein BC937DRAFT_94041 [Endogone sp. FLAS-F59071]|eukprot:RUS14299.1 hypothetical protein BC937DRAFT_94041 [Endogone sp. FLAS-F59071]
MYSPLSSYTSSIDIHDGKTAIIERQKLLIRERSAQEANRLKGEFLAVMSHEVGGWACRGLTGLDMRTPLTGVCGMIDLLKDTELNHEQAKYIEMVEKSARLLLIVIGDILDFTKIEAGRIDLELIPFDLSQLLTSTEHILRHQPIDERQIHIVFDHVDLPFRLVGDPSRIAQVLLNILCNAIKFTDAGEVRMSVKIEEGDEGQEEETARVQFKVSDTGIGMSEEVIKNLFRPFTQADRSLSRKHGGTGLGLVISNRLLELMGSRLRVESEPYKGSTFWFDLILPKVPLDLDSGRRSESDEGFADREDMPLTPLSERSLAFPELEHSYKISIPNRSPSPAQENQLTLPPSPGTSTLTSESSRSLSRQSPPMIQISMPSDIPTLHALSQLSPPLHDSDNGAHPDDAHMFSTSKAWRILVAEDNEVNKLIIKKFLSRMQWADTVIVSDGVEAMEEYERSSFDIVLLDQSMPRMSGDEVTRAIREKDEHQIIISLSANALLRDQQYFLSIGMNDHISKPIDFRVLEAKLKRWIVIKARCDQQRSIGSAEQQDELEKQGKTEQENGAEQNWEKQKNETERQSKIELQNQIEQNGAKQQNNIEHQNKTVQQNKTEQQNEIEQQKETICQGEAAETPHNPEPVVVKR